MRSAIVIALLAIVVSCDAAVVVDHVGELNADSPTLPNGEHFETFTIPVRQGDVVVCMCATEGFAPYMLAVTDDDRRFERSGGQLTFVALQDGEATVAITSVAAGETGPFSLQVDVLPMKLPEGDGPDRLLEEQGTLGPGDRVLEGGEYADTFEVQVEAGRANVVFVSAEFDAYLVTHAPGAQPVDVDDTDGTDPEFVWIGDGGPATIVVTSANPGETGGYEITVLAADLDYMAPVPQHLAAPNEPNEPATPAAPERPGGPPQIPPAPKLEGNAPLDLTRVEWGVEAPEPGTASDLLTQGLHRMNYIEVEIWGQMDCYEANAWPEREWPRGFGWSIDNYLQGAAGGPPVKCPLTWTGDIFSAYGMQPNGEGGHMERVHVTGRVSANGDRILWVLVRSFEQGVYEDEDDRFASYQEWKSLGLVDLPLNNPHWQAYGDERVTTMAELMGKIDETLVLRDGFTYAWESHGDAGKHVMEAGYMLRAPGQGDQWLVPGDLHMLSYRSTEWQNGDNPPTVRLRFEYNERLE